MQVFDEILSIFVIFWRVSAESGGPVTSAPLRRDVVIRLLCAVVITRPNRCDVHVVCASYFRGPNGPRLTDAMIACSRGVLLLRGNATGASRSAVLVFVNGRRFTLPPHRSRWLVRVGLYGRARRTRCPDAAMRLWTLRHPCLCAGRGRSVRPLACWDAHRVGNRMRSLPARVLVVASGRDPLHVRCSVLLTSVPRQCVASASPASLHRQVRQVWERAPS